jgi:transposase
MKYLMDNATFEKIYQALMQIKGLHIKNTFRLRAFIEAIYYICRAGASWRLLPFYYGDWRAIHKRFKSWSDKNVWEKIFEIAKVDPDMEMIMIDSTIVRAHACAAGYTKNSQELQALGRSAGGFTTKIHAMVDALGNPLKFILTPGQKHDISQADALTRDISNAFCLGDKGYISEKFVENLKRKNCIVIIPSRSNSKNPQEYDKHIYKERHLIECFFGKIKHFRRVFSRFDKSAQSFSSFIYFVGVLIWFK